LNDGKERASLCIIVCKASTMDNEANRGSLWLMDAGKGYTDLLNSRAAQEFIHMTHEEYYRHLKQYFGNVMVGFFCDEPQIQGIYNNSEMFEEFRNCYGYDIGDHIAELFLPEHPNRYRIRADFQRLAGKRFGREFIGRINDWCREHSVDSTGHFLGEESPQNEVVCQGDAWPVRKEMSIPGLDLLWCKTNYEPAPGCKIQTRHNLWCPNSGLVLAVKLASAAARYSGVPRVMAEAYGCMSYSVAPVDLTIATHWLTALGTNFINDNTLTLSFEGFRKRALGGRHFTTPWWKFYKDFAEFTGRCSVMSTVGALDAKIAVLYPILTAQCLHTVGPANPKDAELLRQTNRALQQTAEALLRAHWDWEIIFEQVLEQGRGANGQIKVPNAAFSVVIVPAAHVLSKKVIEKLEEFAQSGGVVIFVGPIPSISIEKDLKIKKRMANLLSKKTVYLVQSGNEATWIRLKPELDAILKKYLSAPFVLYGNGHEEILTAHRRAEKKEIFHLVNMSGRHLSIEGDFTCEDILEMWHPDDGKRYSVDAERKGILQSIRLEFAPWEGFYLVSAPIKKTPALNKMHPRLLFDNPGYKSVGFPDFEWEMKRHCPNMAPMKKWARLDPEDKGIDKQWHTGAPDRNWMPTAQDRLPFEMHPEDSKYVWIKTVFKAEFLPPNLAVVVDDRNFSEAYLNGKRLAAPRPYTLWDESNLKFNLADRAKPGWNVLAFKAQVSPYYHRKISLPYFGQNVVEPVVLTGDFYGITDLEGRIIIRPENEVLHLGPWAAQGLSGYAGAITYRQSLKLANRPAKAWLDLGDVRVAAELTINKKSAGRRCWPPYLFQIGPYLKRGENLFEIKVTSSLGGLLGVPGWGNVIPGIEPESGLLGPVRLYIT